MHLPQVLIVMVFPVKTTLPCVRLLAIALAEVVSGVGAIFAGGGVGEVDLRMALKVVEAGEAAIAAGVDAEVLFWWSGVGGGSVGKGGCVS